MKEVKLLLSEEEWEKRWPAMGAWMDWFSCQPEHVAMEDFPFVVVHGHTTFNYQALTAMKGTVRKGNFYPESFLINGSWVPKGKLKAIPDSF